jgi:hypothetical protein
MEKLAFRPECLVEEGLRIKTSHGSRKARSTDFQQAAAMLVFVSRFTRREREIILARALHENDRDAAGFLKPFHSSYDRRISQFYRRKLRRVLETLRFGDPDRAQMASILGQLLGKKVRF